MAAGALLLTNLGLAQLAGVQPAHAAIVTTTLINERFDGVVAPALPAGWTATRAAGQSSDQTWRTSTPGLIDDPNAVSVGAYGHVTDMRLETPPFEAGSATKVQFFHKMNLQAMTGQFSGDKIDGGVLEIKIGTAGYVDFVAAGGVFNDGEGYNYRIANTQNNPLGGRMGWSHITPGSIHNGTLPASAAGNTIRLRWRLGTSNHTANQGGSSFFQAKAWEIDNVKVVSDKTTQTISFDSLPPFRPQAFTSYTPAATASSNLPVTFSIVPGSVCSLAAGVVTFETPGWCTVQADQAGNAIYAPARATQETYVYKADQTVYFTSNPPSNPWVGTTYTPTAGTSSGGPLTLSIVGSSSSVCSIDAANLVTFNAVGACDIQADQAGNDNLNPGQATQTVNVVAAPPRAKPAVVRGSTNWLLRNSTTTGESDATFTYGARPLTPLFGDWDGNGSKTAGTFSGGVFKLNNANDSSAADLTITFGDARGFPVAGDFNGDGTDDVAVVRNGVWQVRHLGAGVPPDATFSFGPALSWPSVVPVAGDWNGDGIDGIGVYNLMSGTAGEWNLRETASGGSPTQTVSYGGTGLYPIVGDWNGDGTDSLGTKVMAGTGWELSDSNATPSTTTSFDFGTNNDLPYAWR